MKKILYLHAGSEMYGADKILLEIVTGIDKEQFRPIVVLPSEGILAEEMRKVNIEVHIIDYPILRRKYFNPRGIIQYVSQYKIKSAEIFKLVQEQKIDIIHINTAAVLEGIYLKRKLKAKLLWHIHEIILRPKAINYFLSFLIGKYADEIMVVSKAVKKHLVDTKLVKEKKVTVLYNGVELNTLKELDYDYLFKEFKLDENTIRIGMVGRINAWKGQSDFLTAVSPVLADNMAARAFIVGGVFEGEEWRKDKLISEINESSQKDQIYLCDFRTDTQQIFQFFDIFVLPSTNPDPLPTVVLEAMAAGKPVVGYAHGGITEMVVDGENGTLVVPKSTQALTYAIKELVDNSKKRLNYGEQSLKRQQELYSVNVFISNIESIYKN